MKQIIIILGVILFSMNINAQSFYDFKVKTIDGNEFNFVDLKGKKVMIVNTASKCGYTPQYEALQKLYEQYGGENFVIIGFPANNFMKQEPGSNEEIKEFCSLNYGVTFPMMAKISVKGRDMHPLYKWLTKKELNAYKDSKVEWNFQKYIIDENGKLIAVFPPKTDPMDEEILTLLK
ncbi:MAG: glutathione peroxidase [Bacteroidales bacterium]|nr:glutathione peroxidase [Bacteroidales bacterium]